MIDKFTQIQEEVSPRSIRAFELSIGKKGGYLNMMKKRGSIPGADVLKKVVEVYPKYSLYWLLGLSDEKYVNENNLVREERAPYNKDIENLDMLGLSKRIDFVVKQNEEILDKLNRSVLKDLIESEKQRVYTKKTP